MARSISLMEKCSSSQRGSSTNPMQSARSNCSLSSHAVCRIQEMKGASGLLNRMSGFDRMLLTDTGLPLAADSKGEFDARDDGRGSDHAPPAAKDRGPCTDPVHRGVP